jgi:hypothetical protein
MMQTDGGHPQNIGSYEMPASGIKTPEQRYLILAGIGA